MRLVAGMSGLGPGGNRSAAVAIKTLLLQLRRDSPQKTQKRAQKAQIIFVSFVLFFVFFVVNPIFQSSLSPAPPHSPP
jgi:hypothetical protein